jgi:predicted RNA-binding protein
MAHWLLVERLDNWNVDKKEGFRRFGLSDKKKTLADRIKKGDTLIFYISSGISKFSDVREAIADGTARLG